jgi:2-C-methyl-D-erythritol 4-phosphate cytidylyltransferase
MGLRLGAEGPKALIDLEGRALLVRTLSRFESLDLMNGAVIIVPPGFRREMAQAVKGAYPKAEVSFVDGGSERQMSVSNGLDALDPQTEIVVIHDAARPFVSPDSVAASVEAAAAFGAATVAIPSADTILVGDEDAFLQETPDRTFLWACQTPQTFRVEVIRAAHAAARSEGFVGTDDTSLVRRLNKPVKLVKGTPLNFKVTTSGDRALAECVLKGGLL